MTKQSNTSTVPKKIMVIDDHVLFRDGLVNLFDAAPDFKVVGEAESVYEAIENAKIFRPDIILMDFSLPDGTGLDATKAIMTEMPDCKIIFLTIYEDDEKLFAAIRAGAKGYLQKNVSGSELISSLRALDRDEMAISRKMTGRIIDEFSHSNLQHAMNEDVFTKLSPRELDVLCELQSGGSNCEIAQRLFISENTVKQHMGNVLSKLGVKNRREASLIAQQADLKSKFSGKKKK